MYPYVPSGGPKIPTGTEINLVRYATTVSCRGWALMVNWINYLGVYRAVYVFVKG